MPQITTARFDSIITILAHEFDVRGPHFRFLPPDGANINSYINVKLPGDTAERRQERTRLAQTYTALSLFIGRYR